MHETPLSSPSLTHPYELLGPDQVLDAVESLGLDTTARVFGLNSYENRVYQIGLGSGEYVVAKFYRPERWSNEQILEEHSFAQELADLDIPVVPPMWISPGDGLPEQTLHNFTCGEQNFRFALFPRLAGRAPELDNPDNLLVMGRFLGRVHLAGAQRPFRHRVALSTERFAIASREFLLANDFLPSSLLPAYESLSRDLIDKLLPVFARAQDCRILRLHGDCHPGNILWREERPHFVDFDDAMSGPAIQDLWMMLAGDRDQQQGQLLEIIEGYEEFYDFDARELALIEPLRTLRIMHYSAWLARRWQDPAFPHSFPWFNTERYWAEHILELREQMSALDEPLLRLYP
ncbi:MAG: serine/threonine protein kinase [Gammaproteobacteria bacterium]|nr:serine/threonine protein kinase [Gammaproteobacteria bacterium]